MTDIMIESLLQNGAIGIMCGGLLAYVMNSHKEDKAMFREVINSFSDKLEIIGNAIISSNNKMDNVTVRLDKIENELDYLKKDSR